MKDDFTQASSREEADRYDPVSLMFKHRNIMVAGEVNTQMATHIVSQIKKLELLDPTEPITLIINSPGGSVVDGLAIVDMMREVQCKIRTVGNGMQASMGSVLLAAGDDRLMYKNSSLLIHQIMGGAKGGTQHSDFEISGAFMGGQHERLKNVYVEFTGLNHKFWDIVGERDTWLTSEQALKIGFINKIVQNEKPNGPYASEAARVEDEAGLPAALRKTAKEYIGKMSAEEVIKAVNNANADGGLYARLRGELVVRLSEFPEFWTDKLKAEKTAKIAAAAAANDDSTKSAPGSQPKLG